MARSVIGALRVNLGLDSAQFTRGTTQVQRRLNNMRRQFVAVAATAAAAGAALTTMALRGASDIDRIVKAARRIDGSAGAFQALELAAGEAGVSLSSLTNDVQTMNRELSRGSAGAQRALAALQMSADDLMAMDADDRVAAVADRVRELGLSAGEATALLRDLGIRNREMALLMIQGGDAIRRARHDVRDYGLEVDDALGAKIERARDQIGRLGIVTQYFGQRLAAEVVPALGAFAQAITDSMREGGALRAAIDGLLSNMQLLVAIAGAAVVVMGTRYVAALVAARVATFTLAGAMVALRTAIIRTGIGALVVGLGFLIDFFVRLREATGSWGEALEALGEVANAVWDGIVQSAKAIPFGLKAVWNDVKADFTGALADMAESFSGWLQMFEVFAGLPEIGFIAPFAKLGNAAAGASDNITQLRIASADFTITAARNREIAEDLAERGFGKVRDAVARLNDLMDDNTDTTTEAADAARSLAEELDAVANAGGGAGGGGARAGATSAVDDLNTKLQETTATSFDLGESLGRVFADALTGARNLQDGLRGLLNQMASLFLNQAFTRILGGIVPRLDFGGFRADGGPVTAGRAYVVGERGPEMFVPQASGQIVPNGAGGGGTSVQIINNTGAPVRQERTRGPDGREVIRAIIGEEIGSGRMDKPMSRYGLQPAPVRR